MNKHTLEGQWTQLKGTIRKQWGKLTDDDLDMAGRRPIRPRTSQLAAGGAVRRPRSTRLPARRRVGAR